MIYLPRIIPMKHVLLNKSNIMKTLFKGINMLLCAHLMGWGTAPRKKTSQRQIYNYSNHATPLAHIPFSRKIKTLV